MTFVCSIGIGSSTPAVWVVGALVPNASFMCVSGLFSHHLMAYTTLGAIVELVVSAIAGAALYKEPAS
ncbi:MAG: hypothetical protein ACYCPO_15815 [Acidobacteriaceae bacterium]